MGFVIPKSGAKTQSDTLKLMQESFFFFKLQCLDGEPFEMEMQRMQLPMLLSYR